MSLKAKLAEIEQRLFHMDIDDPRWNALNDEANAIQDQMNAVIEAHDKSIEKRRLAEREESFKKRIAEKHGNFEDWYKWALSLYYITTDNRVVSNARDWEEERSWACSDRVSCLEKIEQLIDWKEYDHFERKDR